VDDNHDVADSLGELLRVLGCESVVCYDGVEALKLLERFSPSIAFVDLGMPRMDGYQFAQRFRARAADGKSRLVALTGWSQPEDLARSSRAGFDLHLIKPISIDRLVEVLRGVGS
jgi:CheY-like chemotaxis protein